MALTSAIKQIKLNSDIPLSIGITSAKSNNKFWAITSAHNMTIRSAIIGKYYNKKLFRHIFSNTIQHIGKLNIFPYI